MWSRLFQLGLRAYTRSATRSWLITAVVTMLYRLAQKTMGRREVIDVSSIKPGEMIIIEHLPVTHKEQIKEEKRKRRLRRRGARATADSD